MKKLTQEEFILKCKENHGDRYDYSISKYVNIRQKVKIICLCHGIFYQLPKAHYNGQGCPKCAGKATITKEDFLKLYSRDEYDYHIESDIVRSNDYIKVTNKENNLTYIQLSDHHRNGIKPTKIESSSLVSKLKEIHNGLFNYIIEKDSYYSTDKIKIHNKLTNDIILYRVDRHLLGMKPNKLTLNHFLYKSNELHGDKYDYSLIKLINSNKSKVEIICKDHGVFTQRVSNHINLGDGCPKCVGVGKWNSDVLKSEFQKIHFDKYDYSKVKFEGVKNKVIIICKEHGEFAQNIHKHMKGQGCPECKFNSIGEEYIKCYLEENNIKYIRQHGFDTCRYINRLSFDFYLPELEICIEFDGIQHFKPVKEFGGEFEFQKIIERDNCKNKWCLENDIKLIRIKYNQINKIRKILEKQLIISDKK